MKKLILTLLLILCLPLNAHAYDATENNISPRASYVFSEVSSGISPSHYGGDCALYDVGSGTIVVTLQKKSSSGTWSDVTGSASRKSFSNTTVATHGVAKVLSTGTYRCKTYVIATVTDITETKTVYSPSLTITPSN